MSLPKLESFLMIKSATILFLGLLMACTSQTEKRRLFSSSELKTVNDKPAFLKVHLKDGRLYVFSHWRVDENNQTLTGEGYVYDASRQKSESGRFSTNLDSIAICETNATQSNPAIAAMAIVTGASLSLTIY